MDKAVDEELTAVFGKPLIVQEEYNSDWQRRYEEDDFARDEHYWTRKKRERLRRHLVRKTLTVGMKMNWTCPQCNEISMYSFSVVRYTKTHAIKAECPCGAIVFLSVKSPTINVYTYEEEAEAE